MAIMRADCLPHVRVRKTHPLTYDEYKLNRQYMFTKLQGMYSASLNAIFAGLVAHNSTTIRVSVSVSVINWPCFAVHD